jgi:hypothetical protein
MTVIRFPQRHRNAEPAPVRPSNRKARIHGTFGSPSGGVGTMTGWMRLERFHVVSDRLCAAGVFTGELLDSDGTTIGVGSRRRSVPAEIARSLHGWGGGDRARGRGPVRPDRAHSRFTMDTGVVRRPPMKPDAERFDAKMSVAHREPHPSHGRSRAAAVPEGPRALGRTKVQEMCPRIVALAKTSPRSPTKEGVNHNLSFLNQ